VGFYLLWRKELGAFVSALMFSNNLFFKECNYKAISKAQLHNLLHIVRMCLMSRDYPRAVEILAVLFTNYRPADVVILEVTLLMLLLIKLCFTSFLP
jgi:hypothetical protein